jgi:hypothetical protein
MSNEQIQAEMDLSYQQRLKAYEIQVDSLRVQREAFYAANPDCPIKTMFMNVCAPPQRIELRIIKSE